MTDLTISITPTPEVVTLPIPLARVWDGLTPSGARVKVLVAGVLVPEGQSAADVDGVLLDFGRAGMGPALPPERN